MLIIINVILMYILYFVCIYLHVFCVLIVLSTVDCIVL